MPLFAKVMSAPEELMHRLQKAAHAPEDFMHRLHADCHWHPAGVHLGCLHLGKPTKQRSFREDTVRRLTSDVEQLHEQVGGQSPHSPTTEQEQKKLHSLSEDVQRQLHLILESIKELTDEKEEKSQSPKSKPPAGKEEKEEEEETIDMLEEFLAADLPVQLLSELASLEFEARKEVMNVCCALLWPDIPQRVDRQVLDYLAGHQRAFPLMIEAYKSEEMALHCGVVFRSCMRHRELVTSFLQTDLIYELILYAQHPSIDISADAFCSLREVLLEHKDAASQWLGLHFTKFFSSFNNLLRSEHYVQQRQALTLLCEILLFPEFQSVMTNYVSSEKNLQIVMNLLRDSSKVIQGEAFQLFKFFVANPVKPLKVQQILYKNRDKLVLLLGTIPPLRQGDKQFLSDRQSVIDLLRQLLPPLRRGEGATSPRSSACLAPDSPTSPAATTSETIERCLSAWSYRSMKSTASDDTVKSVTSV